MQKKATTSDENLDRNIDETLEATFKAIQDRPKLTAKTRRRSHALPDKNSATEATEAQFLEWLQEAVNRLAKIKPWPMGATRFIYFRSEASWNLRLIIDQNDFESEYKAAHNSGDASAIFEFARANREAITRPWVTQQLMEWRLSESRESKHHFDKFMRAYWSQQGKRTPTTMLPIIKRDQEIYRDSINRMKRDPNLSKKTLLYDLWKEHGISQNSVKDVLRYYGEFYKHWKLSPMTRLYLSLKRSEIIRTAQLRRSPR